MFPLQPRRLLAFLGRNTSPRRRWEYIGLDRRDAYRMMDGSRSEGELRASGGFIARRLVDALQIGAGHRVLDVGCGVARVGRELAPACGRYHGVDISSSLLAHARRRTAHLDNVELTRLTAGGLVELEAGSYDRAICHKVLLHVGQDDARDLLTGFAHVLASDGLAYLDLWNEHHPAAAALRARESTEKRLRRQPHRSRFYSRADLEGWLREAALEAVWLSDRTFLVQAVVMHRSAPEEERRRQHERLQVAAEALLPTGDLDFEISAGVDSSRTTS